MDALINFGVIAFVLFVVYAANLAQAGRWSPAALRSLLLVFSGMILLLGPCILSAAVPMAIPAAVTTAESEPLSTLPPISGVAALAGLGVVLVAGGVSFGMVISHPFRIALRRTLGDEAVFSPSSLVHITAVPLMTALVAFVLVNFIITGGIAGQAALLEETNISILDLVFQLVVMVAAALLGVGVMIRRDWPAVLRRLSLRRPTVEDMRVGVATGIGMWLIAIVFSVVWALTLPQQVETQTQASEEFANALNTLPLAFAASGSAAFGEEILIRGAIQPVFGLWLTSAFFVMLHSQYLLTPIMGLLFVVSLAFGWVRNRYSTTAAIIAHFVYNFIPLVLAVFASGMMS